MCLCLGPATITSLRDLGKCVGGHALLTGQASDLVLIRQDEQLRDDVEGGLVHDLGVAQNGASNTHDMRTG